MSEESKKFMKDQIKHYFIGLIAFFLLFIVVLNLILDLPFSLLIIEIMIVGILLGIFGGIGYFCFRAQSKKYPKPKGDQSTIFEIKRPKFEIYRIKYKRFSNVNKKKLMGYLEGNVVYNKSHKYIVGYFDDRDPQAIDFIWNERVVMQLRGDKLYSAKNTQWIAQFDDLKVSTLRRRKIEAYVDVNASMETADIMMKTKRGPERVGEIDGNINKLNTARACAIYAFLFDFFA